MEHCVRQARDALAVSRLPSRTGFAYGGTTQCTVMRGPGDEKEELPCSRFLAPHSLRLAKHFCWRASGACPQSGQCPLAPTCTQPSPRSRQTAAAYISAEKRGLFRSQATCALAGEGEHFAILVREGRGVVDAWGTGQETNCSKGAFPKGTDRMAKVSGGVRCRPAHLVDQKVVAAQRGLQLQRAGRRAHWGVGEENSHRRGPGAPPERCSWGRGWWALCWKEVHAPVNWRHGGSPQWRLQAGRRWRPGTPAGSAPPPAPPAACGANSRAGGAVARSRYNASHARLHASAARHNAAHGRAPLTYPPRAAAGAAPRAWLPAPGASFRPASPAHPVAARVVSRVGPAARRSAGCHPRAAAPAAG